MRNLQVIRNKPRDRDKFTNLSGILNVTVKTVSYLHIGSGVEQIKISEKITSIAGDINRGLKELAQSRWKDIVGEGEYVAMPSVKNHPVIPGSSIKGNVRARIELSFVPRNDSVRSCFSVDMWNTPKNAWRHAKIWGARLEDSRGRPCRYDERMPQLCLLCDIFGAQGLGSLVAFSDFAGKNVTVERVSGEFDMKLLCAPPGSSFNGEISFRNLLESELGLILIAGMGIGKCNVGRPVLLGRLKYRGKLAGREFGRVQYVINSISLSRMSRPLSDLHPGMQASGDTLHNIIDMLVSSADREFGGELDIVDEVKALG